VLLEVLVNWRTHHPTGDMMQVPGKTNRRVSLVSRFRHMPLRYRLSIAFFCLAFLGTSSLVELGIISQREIIREEEQERLQGYSRALDHNIELQGQWAVSLASSFALNPEVAGALANQDRYRLVQLCYSAFIFMRRHYGIMQFNFHTIPPRNFVRMQMLYVFGDDLHYRQTILDAISWRKETFGIEKGITGYGIRGVAPVLDKGALTGTVEIGFSFGKPILQQIKKQFDVEVSILVPDENSTAFTSIATTFPDPVKRFDPVYAKVLLDQHTELLIQEIAGVPYATLVRTVKDYQGKTIALVEFCARRTETLSVMHHYRTLMLGIGFLGMVLSVGAIYLIARYFSKPIGEMVDFARDIASGQDVRHLKASPTGELKILADALEDMLKSLEESRRKIKDYTVNLEYMVHLRTRALRESEEKYRTLVENVPLVVYRLLGSGKTIFINQFVEDLLGVPQERVLGDESFWREKVWPEDRPIIWPLMDHCLNEGREFKAEYRVARPDGKLLIVLDHALPVFDERGHVETVDGFLVNVTERHHLQQQIIQTEELKTLSEISARLAHEIRNPLVAAGGFARRVLDALTEGDVNREKVKIIVHEIGRLEKILEKTLAYLKPFQILPETSSLNELLIQVLEDQEAVFRERSVSLEMNLSANLPLVPLDKELFRALLRTMFYALADICPQGRKVEVTTYPGDNVVHLDMTVRGTRVSDDEIEHFFYPFTSRLERTEVLDLPLAKMIIHKHQGLIDLVREDPDRLILKMSLPHRREPILS